MLLICLWFNNINTFYFIKIVVTILVLHFRLDFIELVRKKQIVHATGKIKHGDLFVFGCGQKELRIQYNRIHSTFYLDEEVSERCAHSRGAFNRSFFVLWTSYFCFFSFNCFFTIDKSNKENILSSLGDVCSQNFIVTMFIVVPTSHDIQVRRRGHVLCVLCFFLLTTSEVNGTKWKCMCSCTKGPCRDKGRYQTYRLSDVYVRTAQLKNFNVVYTALK